MVSKPEQLTRKQKADARRQRRRGPSTRRPAESKRIQIWLFKKFVKAVMRKRRALWDLGI